MLPAEVGSGNFVTPRVRLRLPGYVAGRGVGMLLVTVDMFIDRPQV